VERKVGDSVIRSGRGQLAWIGGNIGIQIATDKLELWKLGQMYQLTALLITDTYRGGLALNPLEWEAVKAASATSPAAADIAPGSTKPAKSATSATSTPASVATK